MVGMPVGTYFIVGGQAPSPHPGDMHIDRLALGPFGSRLEAGGVGPHPTSRISFVRLPSQLCDRRHIQSDAKTSWLDHDQEFKRFHSAIPG
jgi:hypothetical protein